MVEWVDFPGARYELLDGDTELLPGIRVIATSGHTPGHQSLLVETGQGLVVITGQAIYSLAEWEGSTEPRKSGEEIAWDRARYVDTTRRLRERDHLRVLFSHDGAVWERPS